MFTHPEIGPETYLALGKRLGEELLRRRLILQVRHSADWYGGFGKDRFHPENIELLPVVVERFLHAVGQYDRGKRNASRIKLVRCDLSLECLPPAFRGFTILHLSDIHADGLPDGGAALCRVLSDVETDLCVVTGDFRFATWGDYHSTLDVMARIRRSIHARHGILGILGNHDPVELVPGLEAMGIRMLLNECTQIARAGERIVIAGVDDPHFYASHDLRRAFHEVPSGICRILLCHSPELFEAAERAGANLFLAGHTHGGQLCLPGRLPLITHAPGASKYFRGKWRYRGMVGHTSVGAGCSAVPVRFFCPPEVTILTLSPEA